MSDAKFTDDVWALIVDGRDKQIDFLQVQIAALTHRIDELAKWRDMDTAPKDGTRILVMTRNGDLEINDCAVVEWMDYAATDDTHEGVGWRDCGDMGWGGMVGAEPDGWLPIPQRFPPHYSPPLGVEPPAATGEKS